MAMGTEWWYEDFKKDFFFISNNNLNNDSFYKQIRYPRWKIISLRKNKFEKVSNFEIITI